MDNYQERGSPEILLFYLFKNKQAQQQLWSKFSKDIHRTQNNQRDREPTLNSFKVDTQKISTTFYLIPRKLNVWNSLQIFSLQPNNHPDYFKFPAATTQISLEDYYKLSSKPSPSICYSMFSWGMWIHLILALLANDEPTPTCTRGRQCQEPTWLWKAILSTDSNRQSKFVWFMRLHA